MWAGADAVVVHPDYSHVVRTKVSLGNGSCRYGSGYLMADGVVLTARHVVTEDGTATGPTAAHCQVLAYGPC